VERKYPEPTNQVFAGYVTVDSYFKKEKLDPNCGAGFQSKHKR
jgi:hypothetical protein